MDKAPSRAEAERGALETTSFGEALRGWRQERRQSQLALSLAAGVSQRHLSFLESGRARPSRLMALQLAEALDLPLRQRNQLLIAAGFAPSYPKRTLAHPDMAPIRRALDMLLQHHRPYPAVVIDRQWNIMMMNPPMQRMLSLLGDIEAIWRTVCGAGPRNLFKLSMHPEGARPHILNWEEVATLLLWRTRHEAEAQCDAALHELVDEVLQYEGVPRQWRMREQSTAVPAPALALRYGVAGAELSLFSMLSSFGTALDVTADEVRVETFFPTDAASEALLQRLDAS
ncbi:helix-turn-helix transcriptional regulator [Algiphilus sp. NNCM1]|nr:helix-turn-helix transcriptional regulator [Algiphilus acroporae]MCI5061947.1 helix-turn-helix transcriptional regulator [Algiphilus sp.]